MTADLEENSSEEMLSVSASPTFLNAGALASASSAAWFGYRSAKFRHLIGRGGALGGAGDSLSVST